MSQPGNGDDRRYVIGLDVGGQSIKGGTVDVSSHAVTQTVATPLDGAGPAEAILGALFTSIDRQWDAASATCVGIGIGFPGPFDYDRGICLVRGVSKFESIYGTDIGAAIRGHLGHRHVGVSTDAGPLPISFRNDAEAAIVGEIDAQSELRKERIIGITLGTGIGSHLVDHGRVVHDVDKRPEGWFFDKAFGDRLADDIFSTRGLIERFRSAGVTIDESGLKTIFERWQDGQRWERTPKHGDSRGGNDERWGGDVDRGGDERGGDQRRKIDEVYNDFGRDLGRFLQPYVDSTDATGVLVLGGVANAYQAFGPAMEETLTVPVHTGTIGAVAAILGAAEPLLPV